jgi:hypothetical protein
MLWFGANFNLFYQLLLLLFVVTPEILVSSGVGLALVPSEQDCQALRSLLSESERSGVDFAFALNTSNSIVHLSLMQATFDDGQAAVDLLQSLNISSRAQFLRQPLVISNISAWATKIVFLNYVLGLS